MTMLLQAAEAAPPWATLGVGGGIASLILYLWNRDRAASDTRYANLAEDYRQIVQENTRAIDALVAAITRNVGVQELVEAVKKAGSGTE